MPICHLLLEIIKINNLLVMIAITLTMMTLSPSFYLAGMFFFVAEKGISKGRAAWA